MTVDQIPIGRFSVITRLSQKALRYYDSRDLLVPEAKDMITGYRYYTGSQIQTGFKIKQLTELGFNVNEIRNYLEAEKRGDDGKVEQILEKRLSEAESQLEQLGRIVSLLRRNETVKETMAEPVIKETHKLRVLSKRGLGRYDEAIGRMIGDLMGIIMSPENQNNFVRIVGPFMTVYHDKEYKEEADIEVAIPIAGKVYLEDPDAEVRILRPKKVVSSVHRGPYESISQGYTKVFEFITEKGYEVNGEICDIYLNDPQTVEQDEILTEIQVPIK